MPASMYYETEKKGETKVTYIKSANSHDATYHSIPEFPTIALPMLSILGLMFIMSRKRK